MPLGIVRLGMVSCFIRNAGSTEQPDEEALLGQPPRLAGNHLLEAPERLITSFDMIVGSPLGSTVLRQGASTSCLQNGYTRAVLHSQHEHVWPMEHVKAEILRQTQCVLGTSGFL